MFWKPIWIQTSFIKIVFLRIVSLLPNALSSVLFLQIICVSYFVEQKVRGHLQKMPF